MPPIALPEEAPLAGAAPVRAVSAEKVGVPGAGIEIISVALGEITTAAGASGVRFVPLVADCACACSMSSVNIAKAKIGAR